MKLIKTTKSICPECLEIVNAEIFEKRDGVWMYKECKKHGKFKGLIEKDSFFYKKTMNTKNVKHKSPVLTIPITHHCNLKCKFCYIPNRKRKDMPLEQLKGIVDKLSFRTLALSGGEPTLRKDIFIILNIFKKHSKIKNVVINTNGIKLANRNYVKKLKKTGLKGLVFSFNGFSNKVYRETNNKNLLGIKLKALENIKQEKIYTIISPTLVKGLNEKDIKPIIEYVLDNQFPFHHIRIRSAARVGLYKKINPLYASEMLDIVAKGIGLKKEFFLNDLPNEEHYHSPYQFNIRLIFIENNGIRKLLYWDYGPYLKKRIIFSKKIIITFLKIIKNVLVNERLLTLIKYLYGYDGLLGLFYTREQTKFLGKLKNIKTLYINIWAWPDKYNIDLNEINNCGVSHITYNGKVLSFFEAIQKSEEL